MVMLRVAMPNMVMIPIRVLHASVAVLCAMSHDARLGGLGVSWRAQHGRSHSASDGKHHGEQNHEPDTQQLHEKQTTKGELRGCLEKSFSHRKPCPRGKVKRVERNGLRRRVTLQSGE